MKESVKRKEFTPKYIPIEDVPVPQLKWFFIFSEIPEGKALVLDIPDFNAHSIRAALHHHQKRKQQFLNYSVVLREKKIYVIHSNDGSGKP